MHTTTAIQKKISLAHTDSKTLQVLIPPLGKIKPLKTATLTCRNLYRRSLQPARPQPGRIKHYNIGESEKRQQKLQKRKRSIFYKQILHILQGNQ